MKSKELFAEKMEVLMKKNKTITIGIIGNYGWGNLGDELLLRTFYNYYVSIGFNVVIFSQNPTATIGNYPEARVVNCSGLRSIISRTTIKSLIDIDVLVFGGGGIINDYYVQTPRWVRGWQFASTLFGAKTMFLSVGATSLFRKNSINIYRKVFSKACYISVRDNASKEYIQSVSSSFIYLSSDAVFMLEGVDRSSVKKDKILISLRNWSFHKEYDTFLSNLANEIQILVTQNHQNVNSLVFLAFETDDLSIIEKFLTKLGSNIRVDIKLMDNFDDIADIYADALFTIGMRFHSLVLSTIFNVPFIGLNYDTKVESLTLDIMGDNFILSLDANKNEIFSALNNISSNLELYASKISKLLELKREVVKVDFMRSTEFIRSKK